MTHYDPYKPVEAPTVKTEEPTIPHAYLTTASGSPLKFYRILEEACPACGKGAQPAKLAVMAETATQETVHCTKCDFMQHRKPSPKPNPKMRRMNGG